MNDKRKLPWPRTPRDRLETIPQFEPDYSFEVYDIDWEKNTARPFAPDREKLIDEVLKFALPTNARPTAFEGKPIGASRYCDYAKHAIAVFEHRKKTSDQSDRRRARIELESAVASVLETQEKLERLASWRAISDYLRRVYVSVAPKPQFEQPDMEESIKSRHEHAAALLDEYSNFSPGALSTLLTQLEPVLSLAIEKIEFGPGGEALRDDISQEFCNEMAYAWILGTGQMPTYPKPNPKSRKLSPFARLLKDVNDHVLPIELKNQTDFKYHGIQAVEKLRKRFPDLAKVRRRSGATRR